MYVHVPHTYIYIYNKLITYISCSTHASYPTCPQILDLLNLALQHYINPYYLIISFAFNNNFNIIYIYTYTFHIS